MPNYYLAIDIGASSGRHILGHVEDGRIVLEEMYRFDNKQVHKNGHDCWDMDNLWNGILGGLKACKEAGKIPQTIGIDTVYFARFTRGDDEKYAIMFDQGDGGNVYWDEKGESLRKAFLKAPLEFKRISSGFSYARKHPVTGQVRPHTAVDYAAPTGTPVVAIGDGTVLSAGWAGGGGNTVKIRHNSVYTTSYMHLSKYGPGIKAGVSVKQGQVIGYVGMTGTATGPPSEGFKRLFGESIRKRLSA